MVRNLPRVNFMEKKPWKWTQQGKVVVAFSFGVIASILRQNWSKASIDGEEFRNVAEFLNYVTLEDLAPNLQGAEANPQHIGQNRKR